jgi:lambda repressor-like predicted transcriptional regulator
MIDPDKRNAVFHLHEAGMPLREISRRLRISRNTVRSVIRHRSTKSRIERTDKIHVDPDLLRRLHRECGGWIQRMHEKLVEEEGVRVGYSTLTRMVRDLELGRSRGRRCDRVPDEPGAEMQHDTSDYRLKLGDQRTKVIASLIYLRYSKRRYLKFHLAFNRFLMKCFFHEALTFWGHAAPRCIIDNTSLARLRWAGKRAVIVPEMVAFARQYGFEFVCHEIGHSDRKAGNERSFWTVETNFFPGRTFASLEDLNRQALEWATVRMEHRPMSKTGLIPAKAFEHEQVFLIELPSELPAPYCSYEHGVDQYGYVPFDGNHYWVPGTGRGSVKVLHYADRLKLYQQRVCVAEYPLPPAGVKNQRFAPPGQPQPRQWPKKRRRDAKQEEQRLRAMGPEVQAYLDYASKAPGIQRHRFTRELFALSGKVTRNVLVKTVQRALRYRIVEMQTLRRIAWLCMSQEEYRLPEVDLDEDFQQRPAYQDGRLTDQPDLPRYDTIFEEDRQDSSEGNEEEHE